MKKMFTIALASALTLAMQVHAEDKPDAAAAAAAAPKDFIMLKVQDQDVKRSDIEDAWKTIFQGREAPPLDSFGDKMKDKFLREVASEYVLYSEGKKDGLEDSPEVKQTLEKLKRQVVIQQLLKDKTKDAVSDEKLKAIYDAHLKEAQTSAVEEYHARHILVKSKEEADDIEKKLKKGGDFDKIAKEKSIDKASGAQGGDLGWFTSDKMVPEFSKVLVKLKKDEISPPVKSDFGWHIIQMEGSRKASPPPFEEVKESLKQEAGNKAVGEYVKGVMANVKITKLDAQGHETNLPVVSPDAAAKDDKDAPAEQ
jgi:peptidyl-prolyl cis-trans isomerase C